MHTSEAIEKAPRTKSTARVREVWDGRLRDSERERILEISGMPVKQAMESGGRKWGEFAPHEQERILIALRDLVQLGSEASYALGYSRRLG